MEAIAVAEESAAKIKSAASSQKMSLPLLPPLVSSSSKVEEQNKVDAAAAHPENDSAHEAIGLDKGTGEQAERLKNAPTTRHERK